MKDIQRGNLYWGNYSYNYHHFLFEHIVIFMNIEKSELSESIPLLVDDICTNIPNFMSYLIDSHTEDKLFQ